MSHQNLNSTVITITSHRSLLSVMLYTYTFTKQHEHCDWLFLGHVPLMQSQLQLLPAPGVLLN